MSRKTNKVGYIVLAILAVVLVASVGMVIAASANSGTTPTPVADAVYGPNSWLNITPGSDPSQLCFSWATQHYDVASFVYTPVDDSQYVSGTPNHPAVLPVPEVQIVKVDNTVQPPNFAKNKANPFCGVTLESYVTQGSTTTAGGWYQNKVTVTGLEDSSTYAYQVGAGNPNNANAITWSDVYYVHTRDPRSFSFIAVGDPQLGASGNIGSDLTGWQATLQAAPLGTASFLLSLGDEVDNQTSQSGADLQYDAYSYPAQLLGIPVATIDGNHDYALGQYYGYHYNQPNQSTQYGATQYGNDGDYWFRYGSALFMMLNSNTESAATHGVFIGQAIAANQDAKWRVVAFHHSLYSDANHTFDSDILFRRSTYPAIFDQYHIDVVLSGHDHSFTRSWQMFNGQPVSQNKMRVAKDGSVSVVNPAGTLYMTLDSGSGSKYYQLNPAYDINGKITYPAYTAAFWQQNVPTFSQVSINDNKFSIVTYATNNLTTPIDNYSIAKDQGPFRF
jgi:hypothetical protein